MAAAKASLDEQIGDFCNRFDSSNLDQEGLEDTLDLLFGTSKKGYFNQFLKKRNQNPRNGEFNYLLYCIGKSPDTKAKYKQFTRLVETTLDVIWHYGAKRRFLTSGDLKLEGTIQRSEELLKIFPGLLILRKNLVRYYGELENSQKRTEHLRKAGSYFDHTTFPADLFNRYYELSAKAYVDYLFREFNGSNLTNLNNLILFANFFYSSELIENEAKFQREFQTPNPVGNTAGAYSGDENPLHDIPENLRGDFCSFLDNIKKLPGVKKAETQRLFEEKSDSLFMQGSVQIIEEARSEYLEELEKLHGFAQSVREALALGIIGPEDNRYKFLMQAPKFIESGECTIDNAISSLEMNIPYVVNSKKSMVLLKIGGSTFDRIEDLLKEQRDDEAKSIMETLRGQLLSLHPKHNVILTVGGGPLANYLKLLESVLPDSKIRHSDNRFLTFHANVMERLLEERAEYVSPEDLRRIDKDYLRHRIPIVPYIPAYLGRLMFEGNPPLDKSDLQTIGIAAYFGIKDIFFLKDTDAIFNRDPNMTDSSNLLVPIKAIATDVILEGQGEVYVDTDYSGRYSDQVSYQNEPKSTVLTFSRRGTDLHDHEDHLIERHAAELFVSPPLPFGTYIKIVDGTHPETLTDMINDKEKGSIIYNKQSPPEFLKV